MKKNRRRRAERPNLMWCCANCEKKNVLRYFYLFNLFNCIYIFYSSINFKFKHMCNSKYISRALSQFFLLHVDFIHEYIWMFFFFLLTFLVAVSFSLLYMHKILHFVVKFSRNKKLLNCLLRGDYAMFLIKNFDSCKYALSWLN